MELNELLTDELLMRLRRLDPVPLGHLPTPLEPLPRLAKALGGPELWVKRDDQTGLATGGNKVRKLAFLMAEALRRDADVVMTTGALQSNHARQTAAAAARLGVPCILVLRGEAPPKPQGNYLLDRLLGAEVRWAGDRSIQEALLAEAEALRGAGRRPYVVPYGGSNALGACGYVAAMAELWQQMAEGAPRAFDALVVASSSGATQAGLLLGARLLGCRGRVVGISVDAPAETLAARVADLAQRAAALLEVPAGVSAADVVVQDGYRGGGYGVMGELEREAIALAARLEGLLVDPVYTGRALGGLVAMIRAGMFEAGQRVLFWHTGGVPALFAYAQELLA